jgi:hypothetical protein
MQSGFNVNSSLILNNFRQMSSSSPQIFFASQEDKEIKEEKEITTLKKLLQESCPEVRIKSFATRLSNFYTEEMRNILQREFYNKEALETFGCVISAITQQIGGIDKNEKIRNYFTKLSKLGETTNAYFLDATFGSTNSLVQFKVPRKIFQDQRIEDSQTSLLHEAIVTLGALNKLRNEIPNFLFTYAVFSMGAPLVDPQTPNVITYALPETQDVLCLALESVSPYLSFKDFVKKCSVLEFYKVLFQVLYALRAAQQFNFTHYNLLGENVVIKETELKSLRYKTERGTEYLTTDRIALIRNFETSYVELLEENLSFGISYPAFSIYNDRSFIIYDVYKLVMSLAYEAYAAKNDTLVHEFRYLFRFFNKTETLEDALEEQKETLYSLPYLTETATTPLDEFIKYARHLKLDFLGQKQTAELAVCGPCLSTTDTEYKVQLDTNLQPRTYFDYYNLYFVLTSQDESDGLMKLTQRFDKRRAYQYFSNSFRATMTRLTTNVNSTQEKLIDMRVLQLNEVLSYERLSTHKSQFTAYFAALTDYYDLLSLLRTFKYISELENDIQKINEAIQLEMRVQRFGEQLTIVGQTVILNEEVVANALQSHEGLSLMNSDPRLVGFLVLHNNYETLENPE